MNKHKGYICWMQLLEMLMSRILTYGELSVQLVLVLQYEPTLRYYTYDFGN
jgi:hypothetical protein